MFNLLSKPKSKIVDKPQKRMAVKPTSVKKLKYLGNVYGVTGSRGEFQKSEYDLGEIAKVGDIEAYARQAFNKHVEQCLKEGYQLKSRNIEATKYVKRRLREMGEAAGRNFESLLRGIVSNVVQYANCFIVKSRDNRASSGSMRTTATGKVLDPVAGYFLLDPTSIEIRRNTHGKILKYKQDIPGVGTAPEFNAEDMVHIYYDRKEGFAFGTPYVVPVLDDIRSLRRMEENLEMLMVSHLYPLFHYIVGSEEHPAEVYEDGSTEVDLIKTEIENMPTEGSIVTPERHEIKVLGAEGKALAAEPYLKHFEMRVLAGLGISEISLGRGGTANRATASTIDKCMQDRCKDFQDVVENFINHEIIKELLMEGGFETDENEDNRVVLEFNEIDIDNQIKMENHAVFKYEHDITTESETRILIGKDPITDEDRQDMYFEHVTKPKAIIMAVDEPYCYMPDTEILTEDGWKLFQNLDPKDKVATLFDGNELTFEVPKKFFDCDHNGKMYHLKTRFLDVCVTPNHKLYTSGRKREGNNVAHDFKLEHAENLFGKYKKFKRSAEWYGKSVDLIILPELTRDIIYSSKKYFSEKAIKSEDWMKFLGWYLSEGCSSHGDGKISISQSKELHEEHYVEILNVLSIMGVDCNEYDGEICFSDFQIKKYLHEECGIYSKDKRIPKNVKLFSSDLLKVLLETMMKGDGETVYHYVYSTISKKLADDVQEIALKCGYAANIRIEKRENEKHNDVYRVAINRDKYIDVADRESGCGLKNSSMEEWIDYSGKVYCVETSTGVVYVRRNGKARWCGNTAEAKEGLVQKVSKEEKKKKETTEREQPSNQHGRKLAKTKEKKDELLKDSVNDIKKILGEDVASEDIHSDDVDVESIDKNISYNTVLMAKLQSEMKKHWVLTRDDVTSYVKETYIDENKNFRDFTPEKLKMILYVTKDSVVKNSGVYVFQAFKDGTDRAAIDSGREKIDLSVDPTIKYKYLEERIEHYTNGLLGDLSTQLIKCINPEFSDSNEHKDLRKNVIPTIMGVFDALEYRLKFTAHTEIMKAYNFGYALAMRDLGYGELYMDLSDNHCKLCEEAAKTPLSLEYFSFEDVAPIHPMCVCTYMIRKK